MKNQLKEDLYSRRVTPAVKILVLLVVIVWGLLLVFGQAGPQ